MKLLKPIEQGQGIVTQVFAQKIAKVSGESGVNAAVMLNNQLRLKHSKLLNPSLDQDLTVRSLLEN